MKFDKQSINQVSQLELTDTVENISFSLLHFVGYILLVFSVQDYIVILIPPQLTDPVWEFKSIGRLVDHVWSPLLGLAVVFLYTKNILVSPREISVLRFLSGAALILGLLYLLMLPLGINNSITIYNNTRAQITNQLVLRTEQLQKLNQQLNIANTPDQLNTIAKIINPQSNIELNTPTTELKNQLAQQIQTAGRNVSTAANKALRAHSIILIRDSVRVNLGTVLAGACLITIWHLTRWVRKYQ